MTYVRYNEDNSIQAIASWAAPGMVQVDFEVERGYDGKLYKAGEAPVRPDSEIRAEAFDNLRFERNNRLAESDFLVMPDYPIEKEDLDVVKTYRQALRDLPEEKGAPWVGEDIPWPQEPEIFVKTYRLMKNR